MTLKLLSRKLFHDDLWGILTDKNVKKNKQKTTQQSIRIFSETFLSIKSFTWDCFMIRLSKSHKLYHLYLMNGVNRGLFVFFVVYIHQLDNLLRDKKKYLRFCEYKFLCIEELNYLCVHLTVEHWKLKNFPMKIRFKLKIFWIYFCVHSELHIDYIYEVISYFQTQELWG